jgi:uncharacterized RDD family membrane protein YckC
MFIIIGGDGKEYGPATSEQVRNWLKAGRANLDTRAKALGSDEWRRLGDYAEFNPPSDTPPVIDQDGPAAAPDAAPASAAATPADPLIGAERGTRLVARLIDWGLETLCAVPGAVLLGGELIKLIVAASQGKEPEFDQLDLPKVILGASVLVVGWLALLAVQVWMLASRGQSIGKRIVGIRIVMADGSKAGLVQAWLMREVLITVIGMVAGFIPFVGPVLVRPVFHLVDWCLIFRDDQRCLHDSLAGTRVVKA